MRTRQGHKVLARKYLVFLGTLWLSASYGGKHSWLLWGWTGVPSSLNSQWLWKSRAVASITLKLKDVSYSLPLHLSFSSKHTIIHTPPCIGERAPFYLHRDIGVAGATNTPGHFMPMKGRLTLVKGNIFHPFLSSPISNPTLSHSSLSLAKQRKKREGTPMLNLLQLSVYPKETLSNIFTKLASTE